MYGISFEPTGFRIALCMMRVGTGLVVSDARWPDVMGASENLQDGQSTKAHISELLTRCFWSVHAKEKQTDLGA